MLETINIAVAATALSFSMLHVSKPAQVTVVHFLVEPDNASAGT